MIYLEVLCEGSSDVPALTEVLTRHFGLTEGKNFRVHPHQGKGKLPDPEHLLKRPDRRNNQLLPQLPIKLKGMGRQSTPGYEVAVLVLVDADDDDCRELKADLVAMYEKLPTKPRHCLFRIAVEETESWFIADPDAVRAAYPNASLDEMGRLLPDQVCGAWEVLARAMSRRPDRAVRQDKVEWARRIAPHLDLDPPRSPSLNALTTGLSRLLA